jgi:hypothetical protein
VNTISRPNVVPGESALLSDANAPGGWRFNSAAFSVPVAGTQGNLGRNVFRGFGLTQWDVSIRRRIQLSERASLQLRLDAFNVLNHPNFANPENRLNNPSFGQATQMLGSGLGGLTPTYQIGGPRSLQASVRVLF